MKKVLLVYILSVFLLQQQLFAENNFANIHQGNVMAGGSAMISYTPIGEPTYFYSLNASTQYFTWDKIALGGIISYSNGSSISGVLAVGPAVSFYFWNQERLTAFLEEDVVYTPSYAPSPFWASTTKRGLNYFINPSVAVGPSIEYVHPFSSSTLQGADNLNLLGSFSVFL